MRDVHNVGMPAPLRLAALTTTAVLVLAGCASGDDGGGGGDDATEDSATPQPTPSTTLDVPDDVALTTPGSDLEFGDTATVAYELKDAGTILDLTVDSALQGSLDDFKGFDLQDRYQRQANYYYVRVTVANAGTKVFGDTDVPLWGVSGNNTLLPPVKFTSAFAKCPTEPLPAKFRPGDKFKTCLVFLSPDKGELAGVSYRPTEEFLPIEWTGEVEVPSTGKGKNDKNDKGKKNDGQGGKNNNDNEQNQNNDN